MRHNGTADPEAVALLGLTLVRGAGRATVSQVLQTARRLDVPLHRFLEKSLLDLAGLLPPGSDGVLKAVKRYDDSYRQRAQELLQRTASAGIRFVRSGSDTYPSSLRARFDDGAAPFLFVRGNADLMVEPAAAVVGARKASRRGLAVAAACASAFACEGVAIVSGGAAGVDTTAHQAAVEAGGTTIVILPQGILDYCVPRYLHQGLDEGRVAVVSEFVPDAPWETHAAVTRNATISACASLICVVEPRKTGGSMRTARHGLRQGKPVLTFGENETASGVQVLGREGAVDLLDEQGRASAARLMAVWRSGPLPRPVQETLW